METLPVAVLHLSVSSHTGLPMFARFWGMDTDKGYRPQPFQLVTWAMFGAFLNAFADQLGLAAADLLLALAHAAVMRFPWVPLL